MAYTTVQSEISRNPEDEIFVPSQIDPSKDSISILDRISYNNNVIFFYNIKRESGSVTGPNGSIPGYSHRFLILEVSVDNSGKLNIIRNTTVASISSYSSRDNKTNTNIDLTTASVAISQGEVVSCVSCKVAGSADSQLKFIPRLIFYRGNSAVVAYEGDPYITTSGTDGIDILDSNICTKDSNVTIFFSEFNRNTNNYRLLKVESTDAGSTWGSTSSIYEVNGNDGNNQIKGIFSKYIDNVASVMFGVKSQGWAYYGNFGTEALLSAVLFHTGPITTRSGLGHIGGSKEWVFSIRGIKNDNLNRERVVYRKENDLYLFHNTPDLNGWTSVKYGPVLGSLIDFNAVLPIDISDNGGVTPSSEMAVCLSQRKYKNTFQQATEIAFFKTLSSSIAGPYQYYLTLNIPLGMNIISSGTKIISSSFRTSFQIAGSNKDKGILFFYTSAYNALVLNSYDMPLRLATFDPTPSVINSNESTSNFINDPTNILPTDSDPGITELPISTEVPIITVAPTATPVTVSTTTNTETPTIEFEAEFTMSFNVIQQGVNDQFDLPLEEIEEGVYRGKFSIEKQDGVYNKDGVAAIVLNIPNPCTQVLKFPCKVKSLDDLNRNDIGSFRDFSISYGPLLDDISPSSLLSEYKKGKLSKTVNIKDLKDQYSTDDPRYSFANPKFFNKKRIK